MKSTVETLSPTRVRLAIEVPFAELEPSLQAGVPGDRRAGHHPRLPQGQGAHRGDRPAGRSRHRSSPRRCRGRSRSRSWPPSASTRCARSAGPRWRSPSSRTAQPLKFTAEVDVRPEITLPDLGGIEVTVDAVEVGDEDIDDPGRRAAAAVRDAQDRRAAGPPGRLRPARPGRDRGRRGGAGRYRHATSPTRSAATSCCPGLDDDDRGHGRRRGRPRSPAQLVGGDFAGREAEVAVTVRTVKERELPPIDDEFAQLASEFDTLDELRADLSSGWPGQADGAALLRPGQGAGGAGGGGRGAGAGGRAAGRGGQPQAGDDRPAGADGRLAGGLPGRRGARPRRSSTRS